jgi:hypothetical protein
LAKNPQTKHGNLPSDREKPSPLTIGWKEYISFPAWDIPRVKIKIDTGARTSALGVLGYELLQEGSTPLIQMRLAPYRKNRAREFIVRAPMVRMSVVTNSGGMREERPVIEAEILLGPIKKRVAFTVTHRPGLLFAAILGRKALEGDFVVDVGRKYMMKAMKANKKDR